MAEIALVLDVVFLLTAFGVRTWIHWRRTGDTGWRLGRPHSAAALVARVCMFASGALLAVAAGAAFADEPPGGAVAIAGVLIAVAAILLTLVAQLQMGASWRIGVDPAERTELVTTGVYERVRNPIYTGMAAFTVGLGLVVPSASSAVATVLMVAGVELQTRAVEEPYLRAVHGDAFEAWARRSGRFIPRPSTD